MRKNYFLWMIPALVLSLGSAKADDGLVVKYIFDDVEGTSVPDASGSGYTATLMNEATIESIGAYNVLNLGNGTGYLDMGAAIGEAITSLEDFTVSICYFVDENGALDGNGRFIWAFATQEICDQTTGEFTAYRLNAQRYATSVTGWGSENGMEIGGQAAKGAWYNLLYRQSGTKGQLYLNGELKLESADDAPKYVLKDVYTQPTTYNWIGRPPFAGDNYLQNTRIYDFRVYNKCVSDEELAEMAGVPALLVLEAGKDYIPLVDELMDQAEEIITNHDANKYSSVALRLLEAVYQRVDEAYGSAEGITGANAPGFVKDLENAIGNYLASALGLKLHYDFNDVNNGLVPDISGSDYNGTIYGSASVSGMGKYKVLKLGSDETGYLDMGTGIGNVIATMENFTVSAYFRVDETEALSGAGNFLWAFSKVAVNESAAGEYMFFRMQKNANESRFGITAAGWSSEDNLRLENGVTTGSWQHLVVRQNGATSEVWINGELITSVDTLTIPAANFTEPTKYNWIGRPPFSGDNYLKNTLVYDFRVYNQSISEAQILEWAALVTDLDYELENGVGDFTELHTLVQEYKVFLNSVVPGDALGEYPETVVAEFSTTLTSYEEMIEAGKGSQIYIDEQVKILTAAYNAFLVSMNSIMVSPESEPSFASGIYYIQVGDYFLTVPENGVNNDYIQLHPYIENADKLNNNQVWNVQYDPKYSDLGAENPFALYSIVSDTKVWENDGSFHFDELGRIKEGGTTVAQSADNSNWTWRQSLLYFNGTAYSIVNHHYWDVAENAVVMFPNETENEQASRAADKKFQYIFRTVDDVVKEFTGIESVSANKAIVYGSAGEIIISGAAIGTPFAIYDFSGRLVKTAVVNGSRMQLNMASGLYIVKLANQVSKVIVK